VDAHYRHTQVGWVILVVLGAISVFLARSLAGTDAPAAWLPLGILAAVLLLFGTLRVEVHRERILAVFGIGLIRRTVRVADVAAYQAVRNPWLAGWGIRLVRGGTLWNVSGLDAVELALRDGRFFRVGTDEPEELSRAIGWAMGVPPSDTRAGVAGGLPPAPKRSPWFFWLVGAAVLAGAAAIVLPFVLQMKPPVVTVHANGFDVKTPFFGEGYAAADIVSIESVSRLPRVEARTNGFAAGGELRGRFRLTGLGDGQLFLDTDDPPYILVRLRQGYVILGLEDAGKTQALYDEMARIWPDKVAAQP
jgi:hypothetical protein